MLHPLSCYSSTWSYNMQSVNRVTHHFRAPLSQLWLCLPPSSQLLRSKWKDLQVKEAGKSSSRKWFYRQKSFTDASILKLIMLCSSNSSTEDPHWHNCQFFFIFPREFWFCRYSFQKKVPLGGHQTSTVQYTQYCTQYLTKYNLVWNNWLQQNIIIPDKQQNLKCSTLDSKLSFWVFICLLCPESTLT